MSPSRSQVLSALWFLSSAPTYAADVDSAVATYHVSYLGDERFQVEAEFAQPTSRLDLNSHESSRADAQAGSVTELKAFDAAGKEVPITFAGNGTWELRAAPARRISYRLVADHDAHTWIAGKDEVATRFDRSFFFAGDAFFLLDYDWPARPVDVEFKLPDGWRVTSPWTQQGKVHRAPNANNLGTNVFALGQDASHQTQVGELQLTWLSDSRVAAIEPNLIPMFERLPKVYGEFWDGSPGKQLTVFFLSDPMTDGGAFLNSFALRLATPLRSSERIVWEHTLAHELMHVWMNNSNDGIPTAGSGSAYWFTEGFTDYLTIKLEHQAGLIDDALAAQRLANQIRRYQIGKRLSPDVSLMDAGKEKHKHWELIYGGGAVLALLLDAELSQTSPTAFRDAMRRLQRTGGKVSDGPGLLALLDQGSAGRASALLKKVDAGMKLDDLRPLLAPGGITVEGFASDEVYVGLPDCRTGKCRSGWRRVDTGE